MVDTVPGPSQKKVIFLSNFQVLTLLEIVDFRHSFCQTHFPHSICLQASKFDSEVINKLSEKLGLNMSDKFDSPKLVVRSAL